jgi:hypothetical protein
VRSTYVEEVGGGGGGRPIGFGGSGWIDRCTGGGGLSVFCSPVDALSCGALHKELEKKKKNKDTNRQPTHIPTIATASSFVPMSVAIIPAIAPIIPVTSLVRAALLVLPRFAGIRKFVPASLLALTRFLDIWSICRVSVASASAIFMSKTGVRGDGLKLTALLQPFRRYECSSSSD